MDSIEFVCILFGMFAMLFALLWIVSSVAKIIKAIKHKQQLKIQDFLMLSGSGNITPKRKILVALLIPIMWSLTFYTFEEYFWDYIRRALNGNASLEDWCMIIIVAISFFLWAGALAYDNIDERDAE